MSEPRWLSASEQEVWRAFLGAQKLLFEQLDRELQRDADIPLSYYEILSVLSEAPERRLRMTELADRTLSSRSRLSHAVARLEEAGWVTREVCATDRRGAFAALTEEGWRVVVAIAPRHVEGVREHLFDQLTNEQVRQLGEISQAIRAHLAEPEWQGP